MINQNTTSSSGVFPTTQWTQIIEVIQTGDSQRASAALNGFCEMYRPAVYNFFRRRGSSHEQAEDYTQEFFSSRILKQWDQREGFLHNAQRGEQHKFRSFLCHVLWRFLKDEWKGEYALRAGGAVPHIPLDGLELADERGDQEPSKQFGREFDRVFALEIIQKAAQRSRHSKYLQAHLQGEMSQQEAAGKLGLSENAFKQAYHRFRERLARDLWDEVAQLAGPDEQEIRAELAYLMSLFAEPTA